MTIEYSSNFLRQTRKLSTQDQKRLSERLEWFKKDRLDPRLHVHPLTGRLKGYFSFSLDYSKRVVFLWMDTETVLFTDVGSHDVVY